MISLNCLGYYRKKIPDIKRYDHTKGMRMEIRDTCKCRAVFSVIISNGDDRCFGSIRHNTFLEAHAICRQQAQPQGEVHVLKPCADCCHVECCILEPCNAENNFERFKQELESEAHP